MSNLRKYLSVIFFASLAVALASGAIYFFPGKFENKSGIKKTELTSKAATSSRTEIAKPAGQPDPIGPEEVAPTISPSGPADTQASEKPEEVGSPAPEHKLIVSGKETPISLSSVDFSVYDLMKAAQEQGKIRFNGSAYSGIGFFVEEIDGIRNDPKANRFWFYYVNGKKASIGISGYALKAGDAVEWKFEKFN